MRYLVRVFDDAASRMHTLVVETWHGKKALLMAQLAARHEWSSIEYQSRGTLLTGVANSENSMDSYPDFAVEGESYQITEAGARDFDKRELSAVLAGLRALQSLRDMTAGELPEDIDAIYTDGASLPGLTNEEIDQLCERLNVE